MKNVLFSLFLLTILISCEKSIDKKIKKVIKIIGKYDNSYYTFCSDWDKKTKQFIVGFAYYNIDGGKIKVVAFNHKELSMLTNSTNQNYKNMSKRLLELYEGAIHRKMLDLYKSIP